MEAACGSHRLFYAAHIHGVTLPYAVAMKRTILSRISINSDSKQWE
jgi:hypothetical protein